MADFDRTQGAARHSGSARQPEIGALAPDFSLKPSCGDTMVRLSDYEGQDVLLVFFRGTWCPNCRRQFRVLCENYERLRKVGMECIGVICQNPGSVQRYLDSNPLPFPLLTDETRNVARQYGVHYWLSYEGFNLAHPSVFILDRDRRVTFAYRGKNQSDLPISAVLEKFVALLEKE